MIIDIEKILKKHSINVNDVVQVGAHKGEEVSIYKELNKESKIYLFEPQKKLFSFLERRFFNDKNIFIFNTALGDYEGRLNMYKDKNNDSQSSSLLKPKDHLLYHSYIEFSLDTNEFVEIKTLDSFNIQNVNLLCIDVQGYELKVLKGAKKILPQCEAVLVEINRKELYEGCPNVKELDLHLKEYGFVRYVTKWWKGTIPWGDAMYIKKVKLNLFHLLFLKLLNFINTKSITYFFIGMLKRLIKN